jgi:16S rRNA pseudouridine516 synthase
MALIRIDKFLKDRGVATRSEIKDIIKKRRVKVGDRTVSDSGLHIDPEKDRIFLDGAPIEYKKFVYLMMNKPGGVITATEDNRTETVLDLLPEKYRRMDVFPVGRLDKDTEGLLLITNNGELAHNLLSPKKHIVKLYEAELNRYPGESAIGAFREGIRINEEFRALPAELRFISVNPPIARVEVYEGKFHQVKRMFKAVGAEVTALKRLRMGELTLDASLEPGGSRELTEDEKRLIGAE